MPQSRRFKLSICCVRSTFKRCCIFCRLCVQMFGSRLIGLSSGVIHFMRITGAKPSRAQNATMWILYRCRPCCLHECSVFWTFLLHSITTVEGKCDRFGLFIYVVYSCTYITRKVMDRLWWIFLGKLHEPTTKWSDFGHSTSLRIPKQQNFW